jgi:hypothetical protein
MNDKEDGVGEDEDEENGDGDINRRFVFQSHHMMPVMMPTSSGVYLPRNATRKNFKLRNMFRGKLISLGSRLPKVTISSTPNPNTFMYIVEKANLPKSMKVF